MDWDLIKFEDAIENIPKTTKIAKKNFLAVGDYPIISQEADFINGYWNNAGDVIKVGQPVLIFGDHTKVIKYVDFEFVLGADGVKVLKPVNKIYPRFFYYYLKSLILKNLGYARHYRLLKETNVPIPPIAEQKQIVAILDEAFANIDRARQLAERNLKNARELFDNSLRAIFESVIGNQFANKDLEALCESIVDCEHKTAPIEEAGYPSIRTPNIQRGYLSLENVNKVSEETYREWTRRAVPLAGDLIMAREAPAGNVAVIPDGIHPCLGQRTLLIRPKSEIFISEYLMWYLLSPEVQTRLLSTSRGATVQHVNMKDIRALEIKYIPELSEQKRIADSIEGIRLKTKKLEAIYQQKITALDELKQSLLQKAFHGELTQGQAVA